MVECFYRFYLSLLYIQVTHPHSAVERVIMWYNINFVLIFTSLQLKVCLILMIWEWAMTIQVDMLVLSIMSCVIVDRMSLIRPVNGRDIPFGK
jgi:hypothetical protein